MTASSASTARVEEILVCYGTQTGNSEHAAQDFYNHVGTKLSSSAIQAMTGTKEIITVKATLCQLDDFLELRQAKWTRLMVIFTSSYGIGQAPLGCRRFRELCEYWLASENSKSALRLEGFRFALCGLGDSKYPTFFTNPTKIDQALQLMKAQRVGPLGKADASGTGEQEDLKVIQDWINGIWPHLAKVVADTPLPVERLTQMQEETVEICRKINPDFPAPTPIGSQRGNFSTSTIVAAVLVATIAAVSFYLLKQAN